MPYSSLGLTGEAHGLRWYLYVQALEELVLGRLSSVPTVLAAASQYSCDKRN